MWTEKLRVWSAQSSNATKTNKDIKDETKTNASSQITKFVKAVQIEPERLWKTRFVEQLDFKTEGVIDVEIEDRDCDGVIHAR